MTPEQVDIRQLARDMRDLNENVIDVEIQPFDAYVLLGCLQFAWRHPGLDDRQRNVIEEFARQLQEGIADAGASELIQATMEMGWHPELDR